MSTINRRLAELKLGSALNRASEDPVARRIARDLEVLEKKGAQAVAVNAHLAKLRSAGRRLVEAAQPLLAELDAVRGDASRPSPLYSPQGRLARERELLSEVEAKLVEVMTEYNEVERKLLDGYPEPERRLPDMTGDDANRVTALLLQFQHLGPTERLAAFEEHVRRFDQPAVHLTLPMAREALESDQLTRAPRETLERLHAVVQMGDQLLRVGPDGWKHSAREIAVETANRVRGQVETVAETIASEGSLATVAMMARLQSPGAADEDGRPIERTGGAFPDLDPIFDEAG